MRNTCYILYIVTGYLADVDAREECNGKLVKTHFGLLFVSRHNAVCWGDIVLNVLGIGSLYLSLGKYFRDENYFCLK